MPDNFTSDAIETLIAYMDGELNGAEKEAAEKLLRDDASLQERYQHLLAIKQTIRSQKTKQRVQAIHQEYTQKAKPESKHKAKIIKPKLFKTFMRFAAFFIAVIAGYGVFQFISTSNQSVYNDHFIAYQLPLNRSDEKTDDLDALYNAANFNGVINAFTATKPKDQKAYFLAAQAYLQLNNANAAIAAFLQVENVNSKSAEKYFAQETDYYLALAYIKAGNINLAEKKLDKITADKQHLFYNKAKEISRAKLQMLEWKEK